MMWPKARLFMVVRQRTLERTTSEPGKARESASERLPTSVALDRPCRTYCLDAEGFGRASTRPNDRVLPTVFAVFATRVGRSRDRISELRVFR